MPFRWTWVNFLQRISSFWCTRYISEEMEMFFNCTITTGEIAVVSLLVKKLWSTNIANNINFSGWVNSSSALLMKGICNKYPQKKCLPKTTWKFNITRLEIKWKKRSLWFSKQQRSLCHNIKEFVQFSLDSKHWGETSQIYSCCRCLLFGGAHTGSCFWGCRTEQMSSLRGDLQRSPSSTAEPLQG